MVVFMTDLCAATVVPLTAHMAVMKRLRTIDFRGRLNGYGEEAQRLRLAFRLEKAPRQALAFEVRQREAANAVIEVARIFVVQWPSRDLSITIGVCFATQSYRVT